MLDGSYLAAVYALHDLRVSHECSFKGIVLGKYAYSLSGRELDDKIDTTRVCTVNLKLEPAAG